jgi:signal transduction histidine kinase
MPSASLPALSQETGLTSYLEEIRQFPLLEVGEEFQLARRWRDEGDTEAAHRLVTSHLRLAAKMALGYRGYGLPMVDADIALVERVLENLIDNALSHSPDGGAIRIPIAANGNSVRVTVADSGPGIAPEHLPRVFDRFYQADNAHRGNSHAGLGLAIVKHILRRHRTQLEVRSKVGEGSLFCFDLPAFAESAQQVDLSNDQ